MTRSRFCGNLIIATNLGMFFMLDFNPGEHICVVGDARPEKTNPIYLAHEKVILILVVERATGLIVDADTNMVCELTRRFLRSVFVVHSLVDDLEEIRNSLLDNYLGDSKRVLYAAARSARMKFLDSTSQARE